MEWSKDLINISFHVKYVCKGPQHGWDERLSYVNMTYGATEHKPIGMGPNLLMFGRDASTLVDIAFETPAVVKHKPHTQWIWKL